MATSIEYADIFSNALRECYLTRRMRKRMIPVKTV